MQPSNKVYHTIDDRLHAPINTWELRLRITNVQDCKVDLSSETDDGMQCKDAQTYGVINVATRVVKVCPKGIKINANKMDDCHK